MNSPYGIFLKENIPSLSDSPIQNGFLVSSNFSTVFIYTLFSFDILSLLRHI